MNTHEDELDQEDTTSSDVDKLPRSSTDSIPVRRCRWCDSIPCRCDHDYDEYIDRQMSEGREDDWLP